jgi:ketosteroid isomerase-like protein
MKLKILKQGIHKRFLNFMFISVILSISFFQIGCSSSEQQFDDEQEAKASFMNFLQAFENGDLEIMEASFSENALVFPPVFMTNEERPPIRTIDYKRLKGMSTSMRNLVMGFRDSSKSPPYMILEPKDLEIQMFREVAIITFHLENGNSLSRRTIVLAKEANLWKIAHIHASNVIGTE